MDLKPANSIDSDLLGNPVNEMSDCKALRSINDPIAIPDSDLLESDLRDSSRPMIKDISKLKIQASESDLLDAESPLIDINTKFSAEKLTRLDSMDNEINCLVPKIIQSSS